MAGDETQRDGVTRDCGAADLALQPDQRRYTLPRFLGDVCERHRGRPALRDDRGRWSFDELEAEAQQIARGLMGAGLAKGTRVGVLMANRREWVAATFGASIAGGVVVPLNTFGTLASLPFRGVTHHSTSGTWQGRL